MRVALVNLPHPKRIVRRWVASYHAPNFLNPPLELMGLGAIVRRLPGGEARLWDAIAEGLDEARLLAELRAWKPDLLVTMPGFQCFPSDLRSLDRLAEGLPGTRVAVFGYLPSQFPRELLERSRADFVLREEPELTFSELLGALEGRGELRDVRALAWRGEGGVVLNPDRPRIADLDALPFPDHSLVRLELYNEPYLERPIGVIMAERGCPHRCTYCVRTFGRKLVSRSAASLLAEIDQLRREHGIRNLRFMDDTFTLHRARTRELCQGLIERGPGLSWSCLTRVDAVDAELLDLMRRAGCRRLYVGVESGSQKVLDSYDKGLTVETIRRQVPVIQRSGIESSMFFVVGAPAETEADLDESIALARDLDLDYVIVTKLQYWPGTELFAREGHAVDFDPFREGELLYRPPGYEKAGRFQRRFYREFYLRPRYFRKRLGPALRSPRDTVVGFAKLVAWLLRPGDGDDFI